jgi:hypothetical protein
LAAVIVVETVSKEIGPDLNTASPRSLAGGWQEPDTVSGTPWTGKLVRASRLVKEAEAASNVDDFIMAKARAAATIVEL